MFDVPADYPIKVGDWIKVPAGTVLVYDRSKCRFFESKTSRDVTVQVTAVKPMSEFELTRLLENDSFAKTLAKNWIKELTDYPTHIYGQEYTEEVRAANEIRQKEINDRYFKIFEQRLGYPPLLVEWSNGAKQATVGDVKKADAPAERKKAEPKINKRQQMVNKSRWKFTQDHDLVFELDNPAYKNAVNAFHQKNQPLSPWININGVAHHIGNFDAATQQRYKAAEAAYEAAHKTFYDSIKNLPKYQKVVVRKIKAGDVFTVDGKFLSYNPYGFTLPEVGAVARVIFEGDSNHTYLPYTQVSDIIEAEEIPTVNVYVLRQKSTGLFYKGSSYRNGWKPEWVDGFMKAKHFDGMGRAKTQILLATGYYNGLPGSDESLPEWAGGPGSLEITDDMELVHFDKLARKEVGIVEDFHAWFKRSWELRALTVKYGSSVRTVYKELEKKDLLDSQKVLLVFTASDEAVEDMDYDDRTALTDEDKKHLEDAIESAGLKKGTFKKAIDYKSMAISFADKRTAMLFKLSYNGQLKSTILDLDEMKEVVE